MKTVLLPMSIRDVHRILTYEKTLIFKKSIPTCQMPFKVLLYCIKNSNYESLEKEFDAEWITEHNGKVVAEFVIDSVSTLLYNKVVENYVALKSLKEISPEVLVAGNTTKESLIKYGKEKNLNIFAIVDLKKYEVPTELQNYNIETSPLNWKYIN